MQAEEAALLAVDMAAAERRIRSSLDTHISELRQQIESEQRAELSELIKLQVGPSSNSTQSLQCMVNLLHGKHGCKAAESQQSAAFVV